MYCVCVYMQRLENIHNTTIYVLCIIISQSFSYDESSNIWKTYSLKGLTLFLNLILSCSFVLVSDADISCGQLLDTGRGLVTSAHVSPLSRAWWAPGAALLTQSGAGHCPARPSLCFTPTCDIGHCCEGHQGILLDCYSHNILFRLGNSKLG